MQMADAGEAAFAWVRARRVPRGLRLAARLGRYYAIWCRFRRDTMVARNAYLANLYLADKFLTRPALAQGAIVECGTWRGGMAAGLALVGGPMRDYHFFDSFAGLPPPSPEDGESAGEAQRTGALYFDNNTASLEQFMRTIARAGLPGARLHVHKGWFADTLPRADVVSIALLRLDGDWHRSTWLCLEAFWDRLLPGALVLIDDYYAWEGCTKAVHEFLAAQHAAEPIQVSRFGKVAYLQKR
jgi:O-methyltransferase